MTGLLGPKFDEAFLFVPKGGRLGRQKESSFQEQANGLQAFFFNDGGLGGMGFG